MAAREGDTTRASSRDDAIPLQYLLCSDMGDSVVPCADGNLVF